MIEQERRVQTLRTVILLHEEQVRLLKQNADIASDHVVAWFENDIDRLWDEIKSYSQHLTA